MYRFAPLLSSCLCILIVGCASSGTSKTASDNIVDVLEPPAQLSDAEGEWVQHGVITVTGINPRSDIVVLAPSNQHVVWKREVLTSAMSGQARIETQTRQPINNNDVVWVETGEFWPIEGGEGVVQMCKPKSCYQNRCVGRMRPCENPDNFACESGKMGEFCTRRTNP